MKALPPLPALREEDPILTERTLEQGERHNNSDALINRRYHLFLCKEILLLSPICPSYLALYLDAS